jgi:hypothetical protein
MVRSRNFSVPRLKARAWARVRRVQQPWRWQGLPHCLALALIANQRFVSCVARLLAGCRSFRAAVGGIALWVLTLRFQFMPRSFAVRLDDPALFADVVVA